jgi:hypothetical protein
MSLRALLLELAFSLVLTGYSVRQPGSAETAVMHAEAAADGGWRARRFCWRQALFICHL